MKQEITSTIQNRKASFSYEVLDKYEAGIQLVGTEVKSLRIGKASIAESYCVFVNNELFLRNSTVEIYKEGNILNHIPKRERKLLLTKAELNKLQSELINQGLTIIPLQIYFKKGRCKVQIALAKGKKLYDKRQAIKERDLNRENLKS